jgi:hypothetical protein
MMFTRTENTVMKELLFSLVAIGGLQFGSLRHAQVRVIINHQGRVSIGGTNSTAAGNSCSHWWTAPGHSPAGKTALSPVASNAPS